MKKKRKSLTEQMAIIGNGINGAMMNPEIMRFLEPLGYTEAKMGEGRSLFDETQNEIILHQRLYGERYSANEAVESLWEEKRQDYRQILDLCRIGLRNKSGALHSLHATGKRSRALIGFINEARLLYSNLLEQPDYLQTMATFGITSEKLHLALSGLQQLENAYQHYIKERGEAQDATTRRDALFATLNAWYRDFRAVARISLAASPQLLEALGIVVKR
jgi:hypothetical protein